MPNENCQLSPIMVKERLWRVLQKSSELTGACRSRRHILVEASEEAESLFIFLGVLPDDLHSIENPHTLHLPSIAAWFDADDGLELDGESDDEDGGDVDELQRILDNEENSPISRRAVIDETCMTLTGAAL